MFVTSSGGLVMVNMARHVLEREEAVGGKEGKEGMEGEGEEGEEGERVWGGVPCYRERKRERGKFLVIGITANTKQHV